MGLRQYLHQSLLALLLVAMIFASSEHAFAGTYQLQGEELFNRCYAHLTRKPLPQNQTYLAQVKAGTLDPVAACLKVLEGAFLQTSGTSAGLLKGGSVGNGSSGIAPEALSVLHTLNDFHRTWFPSDNFALATVNGAPVMQSWGMDSGEAALHVSRALLQPGVNYSSIVTSDPTLEALRTGLGNNSAPAAFSGLWFHYDGSTLNFVTNNTSTTTQTYGPGLGHVNDPISTQSMLTLAMGEQSASIPGVQFGDLVGMRPITAATNAAKFNASIVSRVFNPVNTNITMYPNQSYGGGIVGTHSYLVLNNGRYDQAANDGGLKQPRRWSEHVFSDLLCRSLPLVRADDAKYYVETGSASNIPAFRKSVSCMQCHAGMDPMASSIRDLAFRLSTGGSSGLSLELAAKFGNATMPAESGVVDSDLSYYKRPANGTLRYRSYDGTLINQPVLGLAGANGLGAALANTNDLYVCAAKRYFQYFTGIDVNLQDQGDPENTPVTGNDLYYRNLVIQLGLQFKQSQNTESLIQAIMNTSVYQNSAFKAAGN